MAQVSFQLNPDSPKFVGSFGNLADLRSSRLENLQQACDIVEIRLDLLFTESGEINSADWAHLAGIPLLFTARRSEEGGAGHLDALARSALLMEILDEAAIIDIEVASIGEMSSILNLVRARDIPWIASFHDFTGLPDLSVLMKAEMMAHDAGASVFKVAALLDSIEDLARLADYQRKDHPLPVSTMGMGALAPVSRLLNTQCGSILNYGYLGKTPTAPGQWDCALLKTTASRLVPLKN